MRQFMNNKVEAKKLYYMNDNVVKKDELISSVAEATKMTKKDVLAVVNTFFSEIQANLAEGKSCDISKFAKISFGERGARTLINFKTKQEIEVPACKILKIKLSKCFKDCIKK